MRDILSALLHIRAAPSTNSERLFLKHEIPHVTPQVQIKGLSGPVNQVGWHPDLHN
jgi:hypothetical protein